MKKHFFAGLAILLPIALTILIVNFFLNLLTRPFEGIIRDIFEHFRISDLSFSIFSPEQVLFFISKLVVLLLLIIFTFLVGFIAEHMFVHYFFKTTDQIMHKIPYINKIYKACQDVVNTIFSPKSSSFSKVALVPFPHESTLSIGLITSDMETKIESEEDLISVFVPGTPNPTMGFMLLFKRKQLIYVDMTVEEALKYVISCGVMISKFSLISQKN